MVHPRRRAPAPRPQCKLRRTEPGQHDHTVSIYIFRTDFPEPKVLLHYHAKMQAYAQFGGHVELDETPWQAALHELREETGYAIEQLKLLQPAERLTHVAGATVHPHPAMRVTMAVPGTAQHYHTDTVYVLTASQPPKDAPHEGESTDIRLYSEAELDAAKDEIETVTYDIARHAFGEILPRWQLVPAANFKL